MDLGRLGIQGHSMHLQLGQIRLSLRPISLDSLWHLLAVEKLSHVARSHSVSVFAHIPSRPREPARWAASAHQGLGRVTTPSRACIHIVGLGVA